MINSPEVCLIACAGLPILAAIGTMCAILRGRPILSLCFAKIEFASGFVCGAILAALLSQGTGPTAPVIRSSDLTWFTFSGNHSFSIAFGLEATCIKASLVSLTGGIALLALSGAGSRRSKPFSNDLVLTISLLYAAGVLFVFAPNLAQALLGWCAVTLLSTILIRQARARVLSSMQDRVTGSNQTAAWQSQQSLGTWPRSLRLVANVATSGGQFVTDRIWRPMTRYFPNWIGEQVEFLENSPASLQFIATVFGASAILLTWLW